MKGRHSAKSFFTSFPLTKMKNDFSSSNLVPPTLNLKKMNL